MCTVPGDPSSFFIPPLKIRTNLSTRPLEDGYLEAVFICKIPFPSHETAGNPWVKSGNPWVAKTCRSISIVAVALVLDGTQIYFNPLAVCINH